jgi:hypothetical protein
MIRVDYLVFSSYCCQFQFIDTTVSYPISNAWLYLIMKVRRCNFDTLILLLQLLQVGAERRNNLRRLDAAGGGILPEVAARDENDEHDANNSTIQLCRITVQDMQMEDEDGSLYLQEDLSCIPILNGTASINLYTIVGATSEMLETAFDEQDHAKIHLGELYVSISDLFMDQEQHVMLLSDRSVIAVIQNPMPTARSGEKSAAIGRKTFAVVRITTRDAEPDDSLAVLREGLGSGVRVNLRTQMAACSFDALQWDLAIAIEVHVDDYISNFKSGSALVSAAQIVLEKQIGKEAPLLADKVLMCLPPGTGNWVASSGVNHWRAQFNNGWCRSLTATIHELGHTIGLLHSNENGKPVSSIRFSSPLFFLLDSPRCFTWKYSTEIAQVTCPRGIAQ